LPARGEPNSNFIQLVNQLSDFLENVEAKILRLNRT
jgi:hypothetical protein